MVRLGKLSVVYSHGSTHEKLKFGKRLALLLHSERSLGNSEELAISGREEI